MDKLSQPLDTLPSTGKLSRKFTLLILGSVFIPVIISSIISLVISPGVFPQVLILTATLALLMAIFTTVLVRSYLKPLEQLYEGVKVLSKGEFNHRFNIHGHDEFEAISQLLNGVSARMAATINNLSVAKDYASIEKNKLDSIIGSVIDGIIVLDLHRQVMLTNKSAENITGFTKEELYGKPLDSLILVKDQSGQTIPPQKLCQIPSDNNLITNIPQQVNLTGKNGKETKVIITSTQITEGIQANLGCMLLIRNVSQKEQLEQMQIDFVSMASHELRTPVTSIIGYLSTLAEETKEKLTPEQYDFLNRAFTSAQQLAALISNFLNVSKIERGAFVVSMQPLDWQQNLTKAVEDNQTQASQRNITLKLNIPPSLPKVMADNVRINEVLNNLISNAINYGKASGTIEVGVKVDGQELLTYIADDGQGIPPDAIPHLFTKFFRVAGSLEAMKKGTGLGLYISKSIIDMHHGRIWVESKVGTGSTFYFTLPIAFATTTPTIVSLHTALSPTGITPLNCVLTNPVQTP